MQWRSSEEIAEGNKCSTEDRLIFEYIQILISQIMTPGHRNAGQDASAMNGDYQNHFNSRCLSTFHANNETTIPRIQLK